MQNAPTDVTLMYRYETNSYPNAVYIEPGPFSRFKSLLHDQGFVAIGGLAVILGSATILAMNKRKISTVSKSVTRFFKNLIYGRPNIGTEHIVPIVPKREETEAPAAIENKPETPKVEEVIEPEEVEAVEEEAAEEATPAAVEAPAEAPVKVCTEDEKAACTNDCSQCPNNGDIENIKKFSCKEGSACDCSALPKDVQMKPIAVDLSEGTDKWICRCGQSAKFPYCDGAHKAYNAEHGTSITPLKVNKETSGKDTVYVCACGHAKGRPENPFCDGTHRRVHEVKPEAEAEAVPVEAETEAAPVEAEAAPVEAEAAPVEAEVAPVEAEAAPVEAEATPVEDVSSSNFEVSDSTVIVDAPVEEQAEVTEPVAETAAEPVVEAVAEPVVEAEVEPVVEAVAEPTVEAEAEVVEPVVEPAVEAEVEPVPASEEVVEAPVEQVQEVPVEQVEVPVKEVEVSEQPKDVVDQVVEEQKPEEEQ